jgi:hypothetical protein
MNRQMDLSQVEPGAARRHGYQIAAGGIQDMRQEGNPVAVPLFAESAGHILCRPSSPAGDDLYRPVFGTPAMSRPAYFCS